MLGAQSALGLSGDPVSELLGEAFGFSHRVFQLVGHWKFLAHAVVSL